MSYRLMAEPDRPVALPVRAQGLVRGLLYRAADFILPPRCLSCRAPVQGEGGLCGGCWSSIDHITHPLCDRLGIPLSHPADGPIVSAAALADPPRYGRARAVARYDGVMRELIHGLKYGDRHEGVRLFSRWMRHAGEELLAETDVLVPVPLARTRLWARRFNQSALLASRIAAATGLVDAPLALRRTRRTVSQVGLSHEQRRRNVAGAFRVPERRRHEIEGKRVLLIDDVITTGATANACARALDKAGAQSVDVLALARVVDPLTPRL